MSDARGDGDAPEPTVLMVPGLTCDEYVWAPQADLLSTAGWRCRVAAVSLATTVDAMAASALSSIEGAVHLAGLSMGGYVALAMCRQAPERVLSLTLVGSSARADTTQQAEGRRRLADVARSGGFDEVVPSLLDMFLGPRADARLRSGIEEMIRRAGPEVFAEQEMAIAHRPDARPTLPGVAVPTLVLCGSEDRINPPAVSTEIASSVPTSQLHVFGGAGHLCNLESAEEVARVMLAFLAGVATPAAGKPRAHQ